MIWIWFGFLALVAGLLAAALIVVTRQGTTITCTGGGSVPVIANGHHYKLKCSP